jgi:hypothetical protein
MRARRAWLLSFTGSARGAARRPPACVRAPASTGWALGTAAAVAGALLASAAPALAGQWALASCANPGGSVAPSEGWSSFASGGGYGSNNSTSCAPGSPMYAILSADAPVSVGSAEVLQYTPPAGSTLVGGQVRVTLRADGHGFDASGIAVAYTPAFAYDGSDVFFQCAYGLTPCYERSDDFSGVLALPPDRGGSLYLAAGCGGIAGQTCDEGGGNYRDWSLVELSWADLLLESDATPTASGFSGSLLQPEAHGTSNLQFSAQDPGGPGVYSVTVQIDGADVYRGTPDGNGGHCAPQGSEAGALLFDYAQPCKVSEAVDLPIDTTALADGAHELKVTVTDAAQNSSVVYDGTITTANRTTVSALLSSPLSSPPAGEQPSYAILPDRRTARLMRGVRRSFKRSALRLSGELRNAANAPAPGVTVWLLDQEGNHPTGAWAALSHTTTDAAGRWMLHAPTGPSRALRIVAGNSAQVASAAAGIDFTESVAPSLSLRVSARGGARLLFRGRLAISPLGRPRPLIIIETPASGGWEAVGQPVRVARNGSYRYVFRSSPLTLGRRFAFRARTPETSLWRAARSPVRRAVVR